MIYVHMYISSLYFLLFFRSFITKQYLVLSIQVPVEQLNIWRGSCPARLPSTKNNLTITKNNYLFPQLFPNLFQNKGRRISAKQRNRPILNSYPFSGDIQDPNFLEVGGVRELRPIFLGWRGLPGSEHVPLSPLS